jgi:hypothetical protein
VQRSRADIYLPPAAGSESRFLASDYKIFKIHHAAEIIQRCSNRGRVGTQLAQDT